LGLFDIEIKDINDQIIDWNAFKGKMLLFVNVASECGFTKQYKQLEELFGHYQDKLEIIAMPCNDFGGQEPGTAEEISQFCERNYGVTFSISEKINIKTNPHPLIQYLCAAEETIIDWNFNKFMVDSNGVVLAHYKSAVEPLDDQILNHLA